MKCKKTFFNSIAHTYKNRPETITLIANEIIPLLRLSAGQCILDACSGNGVLIPLIKKEIKNGKLVELDFSQNMLEQAKNIYLNEADFVLGNIEDIPFSNVYFDAAICHNAMPHIDNKLKAFSEVYRVLKEKGIFVISHNDSKNNIDNHHKHMPSAVNCDLFPSNNDLLQIIEECGFKDLNIIDNDKIFIIVCKK